VEGLDRALVFGAQPDLVEAPVGDRGEELGSVALAARDRGVGTRPVVSRQQQLQPVVAGVVEAVDIDQGAHLGGAPAGDRADQSIALDQPLQHLGRTARQRRILGALDDRRQGAVEVGEDRGLGGLGAERFEQLLPGGPRGQRFTRHRT
jgi:hypothetical protein